MSQLFLRADKELETCRRVGYVAEEALGSRQPQTLERILFSVVTVVNRREISGEDNRKQVGNKRV